MDDLLRALPCGFLSFDDDGTILLTNTRLGYVLGYEPGELEGKHIETILSSGGRIFYHTHFFPLLKMQRLAEEIYFSLRSKSGEDVPVLSNAARRDRDGRPVNDCIFVRIRQRHKYEDEILRARKAAEQASAAKAKFLSMMSHDLRTPLQAITGYAELLLLEMRGPVTDDQKIDLAAIKSAGQVMMRLINDILSFAQLESGRVDVRIQKVRIGEALERCESLMRVRFEERAITYESSACEADLAAAADPDRLQQILLNLLTNAVKFTPSGGRVSVECERLSAHVLIRIRDTGIGIPKERLDEIFEPFVQVATEKTLSSRDGVGLGLSISRELARAMGGDLTADSDARQGSTFTISLPAADPPGP